MAPADGTVLAPHGTQRIGPRAMALLSVLAARPGKVFSREELMKEVWSGLIVSDETLSRCISDLRQALGDNPREPRYIETLSRRGYRLLEAPQPLEAQPAVEGPEPLEAQPAPEGPHPLETLPPLETQTLPTEVDGPGANAGSGLAVPAPAATRPGRLRPWQAAAVALALVAAIAAWVIAARLPEADPPTAAVPLAENGLAVLPFANFSDDSELEYFSDGLTEELLNRLVAIDALAVVARTSSFAFKGVNRDVRDIGRTLGVSYVLEGSVRRQDEQVRITAQLIDVRNGFHLFSRVYERPFADVFAIQEQVALDVGAALEPRLAGILGGITPVGQETSPEAMDAYLLGKHLQRKLTVESLQRAVLQLRKAVELDPQFARGHADLATTVALATIYADRPMAEARDEIEASIARALELDPASSPAWHARGLLAFGEQRMDDAIQAFGRAHQLDPNNAGALGMHGRTLYAQGNNREAAELTRRALQKDPLNAGLIHNHAAILTQLGEFSEAERWLRRAMEMELGSHDLNTVWTMAGLKYVAGAHREAVHWYELGIEHGNQHSLVRTQLGWALLELGEFDRSLPWIEEGLAKAADPLGQLDSLLAWHYFQGDVEGAVTCVRSYDERYPGHVKMPAYRAFAALLQGDAATAIREYESLAGLDSERLHNPWDKMFGHWHALHLARARQLAGEHEAAELTLAEAERRLAIYARQTGMPAMVSYYRAAIASLRGDRELAFEHLDHAYRAGWRRHAQVRHGPLFTMLHGDARLDTMLTAVQQNLSGQRAALTP
ncbi:winged helix-turn-helix domain-containing protein [Wenzhouxiangella sp. XN24]|uniref:winged helix-turn-helix domain-containing protein n=1 Tax=Wenzhouxiangella sp. XN24 TaxID=2713569 RepID=UPI0013EA5BB3|nr:tetratricopeptide repeat protein [Wenzhouxiangella sp. XN24]